MVLDATPLRPHYGLTAVIGTWWGVFAFKHSKPCYVMFRGKFMSFEETGLMVDNGVFASSNNRTTAYRVVGVDAGNRQVKIARSGNEVTIIPSVIKYLSRRDGLPVAPNSYAVEYEQGDWTGSPYLRGKRWLVGQLASEMAGSSTFKYEKADVMPELVVAALSGLGSGVISVGELKLCLPDDVPDVVSQVRSALKGMHHLSTPDGAVTLHIKNVVIELEGISAYRWLKSTNFYAAPTRINAVLDIGGGNSSAMIFSPSGHPVLESRKVLPGMGELARQIAASSDGLRGIEGKGCSPKLELILDGIADGSYQYGVTGKSFKADFDQCFPHWLDNLRNEIKTQWGQWLPSIAEVAIVGGAAPLMYPLVESSKGRFKVSPESTVCTVKGMVI